MPQLPSPLWNDTAKSYPENVRITDVLRAQVAKTPNIVALEDSEHHDYTYAELDAATDQLAYYLHEHGVRDGDVVGCHLSRSSSIVICMLGILKAGGAYLLLDPSLPQLRLDYMIEDAAPVIIVSDLHTELLDAHEEWPVIYLSDAKDLTDDLSGAYFPSPTHATQRPAYMAYTSGSTGRPKGVIITHAATVDHSLAFDDLFNLTTQDRVAMMAPIAFDVATEEILPALMAGATVVIAASRHDSMAEFTDEIEEAKFTILNIPSPLWHTWTEYLSDNRRAVPTSLRLVIVGSDKTYVDVFEKWRKLDGAENVQWVCAYGTTETTVTSTFYMSAYEDDLSNEPYMPIGTPIPNTRTYILDDNAQPVTVGEVGELYVGGNGVALGYHNLPDPSRENFMADPFTDRPNGRMYRTGDLARYRPDGNIVWLGRKDLQVKINGLRVELGEIEAVLREHPNVQDAVVVLPQKKANAKLAAFVTLHEPHHNSLTHIENFLHLRLHRHMVPQTFEVQQDMPLNSSGKIDRIALEAQATASAETRG